jgi:hypothetical protein
METTLLIAAPPLTELAQSWAVALAAEGKSAATVRSYAQGISGFLLKLRRKFPAISGHSIPFLSRESYGIPCPGTVWHLRAVFGDFRLGHGVSLS